MKVSYNTNPPSLSSYKYDPINGWSHGLKVENNYFYSYMIG